MSGHHPFSELTKDFTPERRKRIEDMKDRLLSDMSLRQSQLQSESTQQDTDREFGPVQEQLKRELQSKQSSSQFEQLAAALLERFIDVRVAVAKTGVQYGADAGTAGQQGRRLRLECKRYHDTTPLNDRELLGEIDQALARDEALEAWLLAATCPVPEQTRQSVVQHGEKWGVPIVIIDWTDHDIAPLAALCASAPDLVEELLSREGGEAARALQARSASAIDRLRRDLESWCLGFESLRRQSHDKLEKIWNCPRESNAALGQDVAGGMQDKKVKRKKALEGLNGWWQGGSCNDAPAAVVGFEGTGKTWTVLDWLVDGKAEQPVVLIVPSSAVTARSGISESSLKQLLAGRLREMSGAIQDPEHWYRRLDRLLKRPLNEGPILTIVFDGLNQEPDVSWLPILKAFQAEVFAGRVRVVVTTRNHYVENKLAKLKGLSVPPIPIHVDRYDPAEIDQMLGFEGLTRDDLHPDVLELARTPRLFRLVVRFRENLVEAGQITVHRLLWEYGRDTFGVRAGISFSEDEWQDWLQGIALKYRDGIKEYSTRTLGETVERPDLTNSDVYRRLSDIIDGQFATLRPSGNLQIIPEVVAHALGLALLNQLDEVAPPTFEALEDGLSKWLDPIAGLDQLSEILRAAVSIMVQQGRARQSAVTGVLLTAWLQAHNVTDKHRQEVVDLAPNFPDALLDAIEHSESHVHESARSWVTKALRKALKTNSEAFDSFVVGRACHWLAVVYRDIHTGSGVSNEHNKWRSEQLTQRVGTDSAGPISVIGLELELADQTPSYAKAAIPSIVEGSPLAKALPIFLAAAVELSITDYSKLWDALKWLCLLNEIDPEETATGLRHLAEDISRRQPEAGIHPDLPKRVAALLLGLTGETSDEDMAASLEPAIGHVLSYQKDYLPDPGSSFWFPLERRHAEITLKDTELPVLARVQRIGELWLDPKFEPSSDFVAELRDEALRFDVEKLNQGRGHTREDLHFEKLEPALARCAPDLLANLMGRKMQSLATCPPEARYSKTMNVIDHLLLAGETEAIAAKTLRLNGNEKDPINELAAATHLLVMEIKNLDARQQIEVLIHADLMDILTDVWEILRPLTPDDVEMLIRHFGAGSQKQQLDLLVLLSSQPELIGTNNVWSWAERFRKSHPDHRGFVFKTLAEADLIRFGRLLQQEDWSWDPAEDVWVNHYGTVALIEATSPLSFEELVPKLAPWRLLEAVRRRGADPVEVCLAAEIFTHALLADGVKELDPGANLSIDRTRERCWPFRYEVEARRGDNVRENFLLAADPDAQLQLTRHSIDTAASRIYEARQGGAKLFQATLDPKDFEPVLRHAPDRIDQWIEGCSGPTADFHRRIRLAEGAFLALCETLLIHDPERGSQLWRALRTTMTTRYLGQAEVSDLLHMVFRVPDSPAMEELQNELAELGYCNTDQALLDLAIAASCNGRTEWLNTVIKNEQTSMYAWRRQRARVLEGFTTDNVLPVTDAWPDGELKTPGARLTCIAARSKWTEACARHWWRSYVEASDPASAYAFWVLFLRSADRRSWVWMEKDINTAGELEEFAGLKRAHARLNRKKLERAMKKREEKFDEKLLYRKVSEGIGPWI